MFPGWPTLVPSMISCRKLELRLKVTNPALVKAGMKPEPIAAP